MEEKIPTSKIIIDCSHELTDLVREIHRSKAERIVLTFTEQTDILISSINLKVLQEAAEREGKLLIAQIIQNPTGIRNSKLAGIKSIDTPSNPTEYDWEEAFEMIQAKKKEKIQRKKELENVIEEKEDEKEVFEERVEKEVITRKSPEYIDKRGTKLQHSFISIDGDMPSDQKISEPNTTENRLPENRGIGFKPILGKRERPKINIFEKLKNLNGKKFLKIFLFVFVPLLLIFVLGFFLYDRFGTFVKVKIFVESKPIEMESILTGQPNIEEIDFENQKVPIKTEEKTKSLSDTITATGKAFKGEEAKGTVTITYNIGEECSEIPADKKKITLPAGHTISTAQYAYKLVSALEVTCNTITPGIQLVAANIGEEYNIPSGKSFSVQGHPSSDIFGINTSAFTGGTKEEYTVLSQLDVDNAVEQFSTTAIEEVKSALREVGGGWEIIEDTIKSEVDKSSIKTDKKVGAEATTVNLDLTIKGTATYYKTTGLTEKLTELLRKKAEEENLFESEKDLELVLGDQIDKEVSIESVENGIVKIKIIAKAKIKPKIDKDILEKELAGMKWEEGSKYLKELKYSDKKTEVTFNPENYPNFLKKFPSREGGVVIDIIELEVTQ